MDCNRLSLHLFQDSVIAKVALISCIFFSAPALSANLNNFSFIDFNIAFLLGLSLPLLLLTGVAKASVKTQWRYSLTLVASLFILLFSVATHFEQQQAVILSAASVFLALLSVWPILNKQVNESNITSVKYITWVVLSLALLYIASVWTQPKIDAYLTWLLASAGIVILALARLIIITSVYKMSLARNLALWLLACAFATVLYLWLTMQVPLLWMVLAAMLAFLMAMVNTSWSVVKQIVQQKEKIAAQQQQTAQLLAKPSVYDPITNLPSFAHAIDCFTDYLKDDEHRKCAAIVFKPVNFRRVNKVLGHQNSDLLLLQFAYCLQKHLEHDSSLMNFAQSSSAIRLARLQSLNFLVVVDLTEQHHPERAVIESICHQLITMVPEAMSFKSFSLNFELAFGIAVHEHGDSAEQLIANAGDALSIGEKQHLTINYFDQDARLYSERQLFKMERLKQDIADDNLLWQIQPQVKLTDKQLVGFELKVKWHYQREQLLDLEQFFGIAEFSGELYLLTRKMLKQALHNLHAIHQAGVYQPISVSISSQHLLEPDIVDYIESQLQNYSLAAKYLIIEVNEQVLLNASERAKAIIDQLRVLGVQICISDFSGSYESLRYLRRLTVNQIKIDCQNLANLEHKDDKAIVGALVHLAQVMELPLVGYQLDSTAAERVFEEVGGQVAQGKVFEQGVAAEVISDWLHSWRDQNPER